MTKIIDAVSAVFTCKNQFYITKRQYYLRAFPGYYSFPGGKIDPNDYDEKKSPQLFKDFPNNQINCLIRELIEELNFDINQNIQEIVRVSSLGNAIAPEFNPIRFSTYFYRIELQNPFNFLATDDEAIESKWFDTGEFLNEYDRGKILIVPPLLKIIQALHQDPMVYDQLDFTFRLDPKKEIPLMCPLKDFYHFFVSSNTLFPAIHTNMFVIGDIDRLVVDPSPKDQIEKDKVILALRKFNPSAIFLTHHHFDHLEFAPDIAAELNIPIMCSIDTKNRLLKKLGKDWFKETQVKILKEGDVVTSWHGIDVTVYEIPGHDEGHLGLAPKSLDWFIVGDLFQGIGTVVVGGEEGDMIKYFHTLKKVIKLNPKVIFPSHGIGLGGTYMLSKTLEHRLMREEQVFNFHSEGKSVDEILKLLYFDVPLVLHKYAKANIESHLKKLIKEGKIKGQ